MPGIQWLKHQPITEHHSATCRAVVPNLDDNRAWFRGRQFFHGLGGGDSFRMIQECCIYCVLCFYYYISSTSDHQALDPKGWAPLLLRQWNPLKILNKDYC